MRLLQTLILFLNLLSSTLLLADSNPLKISHAVVQAGPPTAQVLAGYMVLENTSDKTVTLKGASSPLFKAVEFHQTSHEGGMMRMKKQNRIVLAPHAKLVFKPGSYHLMLIKPKKVLQPGNSVAVTFQITDTKTATVKFTVKLPDSGMSEHQHHHHH